jgi:hypothetical protein
MGFAPRLALQANVFSVTLGAHVLSETPRISFLRCAGTQLRALALRWVRARDPTLPGRSPRALPLPPRNPSVVLHPDASRQSATPRTCRTMSLERAPRSVSPCERTSLERNDMSPKAHPLRLETFLLLGALMTCTACATASAIRNLAASSAAPCTEPCVPVGARVMLTPPPDSPARVPYEMVDMTYKDAREFAHSNHWISRWREGVFWSRRGELQLPDDLASRCTRITPYSGEQYSGEPPSEARRQGYCVALDPRLPLTLEPPATSLCKLPSTEAPECAVIFYRSASATAEVPVAAYLADGSRLNVVSKRTDDEWFNLALSPVIDALIISAGIAEAVAAGS